MSVKFRWLQCAAIASAFAVFYVTGAVAQGLVPLNIQKNPGSPSLYPYQPARGAAFASVPAPQPAYRSIPALQASPIQPSVPPPAYRPPVTLEPVLPVPVGQPAPAPQAFNQGYIIPPPVNPPPANPPPQGVIAPPASPLAPKVLPPAPALIQRQVSVPQMVNPAPAAQPAAPVAMAIQPQPVAPHPAYQAAIAPRPVASVPPQQQALPPQTLGRLPVSAQAANPPPTSQPIAVQTPSPPPPVPVQLALEPPAEAQAAANLPPPATLPPLRQKPASVVSGDYLPAYAFPANKLPSLTQPNVYLGAQPPPSPAIYSQASQANAALAIVDEPVEVEEKQVAAAPLPVADNKPLLAVAPAMGLETRRGLDLGLQGIYYRYRESSLDVTELGEMAGFTAAGTMTFGPSLFATADLRYAFGGLNYRGSGTMDDKWNHIWEVRGLVGGDFLFPKYSLSPYAGLGFRDLYDDNRGRSTINAFGYRRENQIYYLPIGLQARTHFNSEARIAGMFEYDILLHGSQTSYLSDGGFGDPDIENQQHSGFGFRGSLIYETAWWSAGPFFNYWDIDESKVKFFQDNSVNTCAFYSLSAPCTLVGSEPKNHTIEAGIQVKLHLF